MATIRALDRDFKGVEGIAHEPSPLPRARSLAQTSR
jgi:hypothetical protein